MQRPTRSVARVEGMQDSGAPQVPEDGTMSGTDDPPEHQVAALREVRTGSVFTRTRYLLRGGNGARALEHVGFKNRTARDAVFAQRPVADQRQEDKLEQHTYVVNVFNMHPFGWGKPGSEKGTAERTFRQEEDAERFKADVDAAIRHSDLLALHSLVGDPPAGRTFGRAPPVDGPSRSSGSTEDHSMQELHEFRSASGLRVRPPLIRQTKYVPKRASTKRKTESNEIHYFLPDDKRQKTVSFQTIEDARAAFQEVTAATTDAERLAVLDAKRNRRTKLYEGSGEDTFKIDLVAPCSLFIQYGHCRDHSQITLDSVAEQHHLAERLRALSTNAERRALVRETAASMSLIEPNPFTENLQDCPRCLAEVQAGTSDRVAKIRLHGLCGTHYRSKGPRKHSFRRIPNRAATIPANGPCTREELNTLLTSKTMVFMSNALDPLRGYSTESTAVKRALYATFPTAEDIPLFGTKKHSKSGTCRTTMIKKLRVGVEKWFQYNLDLFDEAQRRGVLLFVVGSHADRALRTLLPSLPQEVPILPHFCEWSYARNREQVAAALGLSADALGAMLEGTRVTEARQAHIDVRSRSGRFVGKRGAGAAEEDPHAPAWRAQFEALREFQAAAGHCLVPQKHGALGKWVALQRQRRRQGVLAVDKIESLDELGFCWRARGQRHRARQNVVAP